MTAPAPSYLDLLVKRAESGSRPLRRAPLCLDPARLEELDEAREQLRTETARDAERRANGAPDRRRLNEKSPLTEARRRVEAAEASVREASLRVVMQGRTAGETQAAVEAAPEEATTEDLNRLLVLDAFLYAETLDGDRIDEIDRDKLAQLLPTLTAGEVNVLMLARNQASSGPSFPS